MSGGGDDGWQSKQFTMIQRHGVRQREHVDVAIYIDSMVSAETGVFAKRCNPVTCGMLPLLCAIHIEPKSQT